MTNIQLVAIAEPVGIEEIRYQLGDGEIYTNGQVAKFTEVLLSDRFENAIVSVKIASVRGAEGELFSVTLEDKDNGVTIDNSLILCEEIIDPSELFLAVEEMYNATIVDVIREGFEELVSPFNNGANYNIEVSYDIDNGEVVVGIERRVRLSSAVAEENREFIYYSNMNTEDILANIIYQVALWHAGK